MKHSSTRSTRLFITPTRSKSPTQAFRSAQTPLWHLHSREQKRRNRRRAERGGRPVPPEPLQLRPLPRGGPPGAAARGFQLLHPGPCVPRQGNRAHSSQRVGTGSLKPREVRSDTTAFPGSLRPEGCRHLKLSGWDPRHDGIPENSSRLIPSLTALTPPLPSPPTGGSGRLSALRV